MQYRQGDVLISDCSEMPSDAVRIEGVVVAVGEATGHSHTFDDPRAVTLFQGRNGDLFARVTEPVALRHEEHGPIQFRPGILRIVRQREYRPQGWNTVMD